MAFNEIIPVHGYVGICPNRPRTLDATQAGRLRELGMSVVIIGGETDYFLPRQWEMVAAFDSARFAYEFTVIPGMGHQYPDYFQKRLEAALMDMQILAIE